MHRLYDIPVFRWVFMIGHDRSFPSPGSGEVPVLGPSRTGPLTDTPSKSTSQSPSSCTYKHAIQPPLSGSELSHSLSSPRGFRSPRFLCSYLYSPSPFVHSSHCVLCIYIAFVFITSLVGLRPRFVQFRRTEPPRLIVSYIDSTLTRRHPSLLHIYHHALIDDSQRCMKWAT